MLINQIKDFYPNINITFVYISEAHATDVWPIGLSAGVLNRKHITIEDRAGCAQRFIKEYDFTIPTFLDSMDDTLRDGLAAWPFRFYIIHKNENEARFTHIAMPSESEFDLSILFDLL